ncbi:MAG: phosphopantetheine-binding protein [Mycoplasmataceae bacterium]|jgi:acyl carrier protein|nr:phosphopantetheine-binding protein [Mycoplasmataceae bacterium]
MNRTEIISKIKTIAAKRNIKFDEKDINKKLKDINIDSLSSISLIIDVEDTFKITIPDDKFPTINTLNDLITIIEGLIK